MNTEERMKERKDIVNILGSRELRKIHFSLTCQGPKVKSHKTCVGCMCPCHDR